jgi:lysylphosphatidylglycerol synthetase-like protein (DUF2156 family)
MPASELTARICGSLVWVGAIVFIVIERATADDEGLESVGNALWLVLLAAPVFVLSIATVVALGIRLKRPGSPRVGAATWVLAGPPALLGAYVLLQTVLKQLG